MSCRSQAVVQEQKIDSKATYFVNGLRINDEVGRDITSEYSRLDRLDMTADVGLRP